ncbi:MAG: bifunctional folylpolyglutamate synthase/dihydrofolate synthase, partial [Oscillospiraceae bacterium]|nr:bifunctional folylpolyglutamate synthase/dihydrofolate synthase [Oscillospiraceae bacterium]
GAHNPMAAKALAEHVREFLPEKRTLICGMMADKDCEAVMAELAPCFEHVITVPVDNPRAISPEKLAEIAGKYCGNTESALNAKETVESVLANLKNDEALVVAGSLYLASEVRPMLMRFKGNPND